MSKSYKDYPVLPTGRINFSKISGSLELPNLVEIQTDSYKWFLEKGIQEVMNEVFPIASYTETSFIDFISCELREPKYSYLKCKEHDYTYSSKLYVKLRLRNVGDGEMKEEEVFMGDIPLMTESGTFIVNGAERVIVSQIVRSPGAYISTEMDKSGKMIYNADLIPSRGTWLEFETDQKGLINVRIDRQKKMPATIILKALGLDDPKMLRKLFGRNEMLEATVEKDKDIVTPFDALVYIFKKLKPGEPITPEGVANFLIQKFFDHKRYDLGRAGRYKYRSKLGIYNRLAGRYLAENLVSADGEIVKMKGEYISKSDVLHLMDEEFFEKGAHETTIKANKALIEALDRAAPKGKADPEIAQGFSGKVNMVKVYVDEKMDEVQNVVGTDLNLTVECLTFSDIIAIFSYLMNIMAGFGDVDDIDNLGNRRIRCVGELIQTQFRIGLTKMVKTVQQKMSISDMKTSSIKSLMNIKPLTSTIREFFASSQLSQFMDQTNPLSELANKRRISALGQGGITRDRASMAVRDVHPTHYGRICPIETPEGQNIGLINNLATYAKVNQYGFIETPYRVVEKGGKVTDKSVYLSADMERDHYIAQANVKIDENGFIKDEEVVARHNGENVLVSPELIDYIDVSPKQIVSIAAACIPFLENDDAKRALMGANMQRQALPLLRPEVPYVGTGVEHRVAKDAGLAVISASEGTVEYVDSRQIVVKEAKGKRVYDLQKFQRSNQGTCINQHAIVKVGDKVKPGDVIADGPSMKNGDLALGQNVTIAFMTWDGYNYEDAVIMSERLVKDDVYTTIHIEEYTIDCRDTKLGPEEITRDIPNVSEEARAYLDENGIILKGVEVKEGDILVGKTTPKGQSEPTPEEKLLMAIFAEKTKDTKDSSLRVPHGGAGIVVDVKIATRENGDELPPGVKKSVRVYIAQKRKISEGDKMSGRHGNKGVISRILPVEDMPYLADGTPVDIMLNPLGVPSRMNIGQILEIHLGLACQKLGIKIATPVFDGISNEEIYDLMDKAGLDKDGKTVLYDGRTGERFDERISVGVMYMIKLVHMVDDKIHARATGPYSLVTQQPLGGKAQNGGQRFGEMEVWALEAYGASHTLQEILTIKSDDRVGRRKTYEAIIKGQDIPEPGIPEAFNVLVKELSALCMDVRLVDKDGHKIDTEALAREAQKEERKINSSIRNLTGENHSDELGIVSDEDANEYLEK
ncbi:MAG: DNA-directed RNA polymerase subunit beta [Bacilli bacterium]|nr:DNA-directed RNA polymerase subunit beta [Bacilli bacterium]